MSAATAALAPVIDWAEAHRDNGRRLMRDSLQLRDEGLVEGAEVLRHLSRLEYARALALLLPPVTLSAVRTGS